MEGRWRLLPDCGIGRVFMRKGAATDEGGGDDRSVRALAQVVL